MNFTIWKDQSGLDNSCKASLMGNLQIPQKSSVEIAELFSSIERYRLKFSFLKTNVDYPEFLSAG